MKYGFDLYSNIVYFGAFFLTYAFAKISSKVQSLVHRKVIKSMLISLPLALVLGLRSIDVGYDTYTYVYYFYERLRSLPENEFVFTAVIKLLHYLTNGSNYTIMLFLFSYVTIFLYIYAVENINVYNDVVVASMAYAFVLGLCLTDQFRQLCAVSLFAYAVSLCIKRKIFAALIIVFIGYGIHNSIIIAALLLVGCYVVEGAKQSRLHIIVTKRWRMKVKVNQYGALFIGGAVVVVLLFYGVPGFLKIVASVMPKEYSSYFTTRVNYETIGFGLLLDTLPILPLIALKNYTENRWERVMFLYSLFVPLFRICGYVSYFLYRMLYYPEIVSFMLYAMLFRKKDVPQKWKNTLIIFCMIYFFINYMLHNNHGAYPYYFCTDIFVN